MHKTLLIFLAFLGYRYASAMATDAARYFGPNIAFMSAAY